MYPDKITDLKRWSKSKNLWMRRASSVSLIIPARKGLYLDSVFSIAETLLMDEEDMVRKGYGWMLKAASQAYQKEVFGFVMKHKSVMPRTSLRYAIEKMPADLKAAAMAK
jgi:3-methyladenine DNA glycosylase AlkD